MPSPATVPAGSDLVAVGADLAPGTLVAAYRNGLFPMPVDPGKRRKGLAWFSPDPRAIIPLDGFHVSRSLRRSRNRFEYRLDTSFELVMRRCADTARPGRWITEEFVHAYRTLFELGWAHSVESWLDGRLVGGVYGVHVDGLFAGESMFHDVTDASKAALAHLVEWLPTVGVSLFDVQWQTPHLESVGAIEISRATYLGLLANAVE
jgi:leucyl/phenylalanyl-tRNA--protein transferase